MASGLMAPVFTPFKGKALELDLSPIPKYAEYLKSRNIRGVLVNGTTGEGVSMTIGERKLVAEAWLDAAKSTGQHVMVQVGGCCLRDAISLANHAQEHGAGSILCLPDLFFRPKHAKELADYLAIVGESVPQMPLFYYHIPSFTGVDLDMVEFLREGRRIPNLAGLKFTHTDLDEAEKCLRVDPSRYTVFLGADQLLSEACQIGFDSAIGTTLNMLPELSISILSHMNGGQLSKAKATQELLTSFVEHITAEGSWVSSMKAAMNSITGLDFGPPRPPLYSVGKDGEERINSYYQAKKEKLKSANL